MKLTLQLPSGKITSSKSIYLNAWRRLGNIMGKAFGETVLGFDPGLVFTGGLELKTKHVLRLYEALTNKKWEDKQPNS